MAPIRYDYRPPALQHVIVVSSTAATRSLKALLAVYFIGGIRAIQLSVSHNSVVSRFFESHFGGYLGVALLYASVALACSLAGYSTWFGYRKLATTTGNLRRRHDTDRQKFDQQLLAFLQAEGLPYVAYLRSFSAEFAIDWSLPRDLSKPERDSGTDLEEIVMRSLPHNRPVFAFADPHSLPEYLGAHRLLETDKFQSQLELLLERAALILLDGRVSTPGVRQEVDLILTRPDLARKTILILDSSGSKFTEAHQGLLAQIDCSASASRNQLARLWWTKAMPCAAAQLKVRYSKLWTWGRVLLFHSPTATLVVMALLGIFLLVGIVFGQ